MNKDISAVAGNAEAGAGLIKNLQPKGERKMACEFLCGRQIKMCGAFTCALVLSLEELDNKCATVHYHTCGIYQKYLSKGAKLPLNEYVKGQSAPSAA